MKKILILFGCLLLTGCNVKYNIKNDENLNVIESVNIKGDEDLYNAYYKTSRNKVLKKILDIYVDDLQNNNYEYKLTKGEDPFVELKRNYDSVEGYLNSSQLFNNYFDKIDYSKNGKIIKIETIGFNPNVLDDPGRFYVHNLDIAVTCAYKVINHNASYVDEDNNKYHFIMSDKTEDFKIILEFDSSKRFNPYLKTIIIILISVLIIFGVWAFVYFSNKDKKYKS